MVNKYHGIRELSDFTAENLNLSWGKLFFIIRLDRKVL